MVNQNFEMWARTTKKIITSVTNDNNEYCNLYGASIRWCLKTDPESDRAILIKTQEDGITISGDSHEYFIVSLEPNDTVGLDGVYYHDCEVTDADGNIFMAFVGWVTIHKNATEVIPS